ncbi:serine hydrolase domain-containing protein [Pseudogracilibacillus auburnensis]|uniref:serine hydrolase domain-containing protein n=1 Tax=Pseudogracilibacillus auburnensis TaxID=1494959 RepID=UPI001A9746DE|nr:serine hydrolase domain-containing protein [Pseudogracilibacillus auburnensis]MBO1002334.1 serine hydrolase [Pseudogracilibacillus auburnensis]
MIQYQKFEQTALRLLEKYQVPGCMIAIAKEGQLKYEGTFGYRNKEKKALITRHTVFGLASITKSFTCVAIMQLREKGKLDIHAPVVSYLPIFSVKNVADVKQITIYHFMTHTSGLPPLPSLDHAMVRKRNDESMIDFLEEDGKKRLVTYDDLLEAISDIKLFARPGECFSYSNDAYGLLGAIIEQVSGMTYEQYIMENIIKPCGMERTFFHFDDDKSDQNITTCYEKSEENQLIYAVQDWWDAPPMRATGFLKSTANDMITYSTLFLTKGVVNGARILSEESIEQIIHPYIKKDPEKFYGFGLTITPNYFGKTLADHGGSLQSISSKFAMILEEGVSAIVLSNLSGFPASKLMEHVLNAYFERDVDATYLTSEKYIVDHE